MRLGIVNQESWSFLNEIYEDLSRNHQTTLFDWKITNLPVFQGRINAFLGDRNLKAFLQSNDVVFFEWASAWLQQAAALPKQCGIVTRLHRYEMYEWVDKINWDHVDKVILVSQAKKREFLERFPDQESKIEIIYEAVDPDRFQFNHRQFKGDIGILCHLIPRKRVYELILVFSELLRHQDGFHLHIAGGPNDLHIDYYEAIYNLVDQLNLSDNVTFYGNVTEPASWYPKVDIFISNSYSEGLQVAPMEAMASGCYCLSHNWSGAEELLPETNRYFTNQELLEKILSYSDTPQEIKQAEKERMRSVVCEQFNVHRTKVQIRHVLESVGQSFQTHR